MNFAHHVSVALGAALVFAAGAAQAGIAVSPTSVSVREGGLATSYALTLTTSPTQDVQVTLNPGGQLRVSPTTVTFRRGDAAGTAQTVNVWAIDDPTPEGTHAGAVAHSVLSADPAYPPTMAVSNVAASITDNDRGDIAIDESGGATSVTEGGNPDSYTIALTQQPAASVTVTVAFADEGQTTGSGDVSFAPAQLTFTPQNYATPQTVTVIATDDAGAEGQEAPEVLRHRVTSADTLYNNLAARDVPVTVVDNDVANIVLRESGLSTRVAEGGWSDMYALRLTSRPATNNVVTVTARPDSQLRVTPASVQFNNQNWSTEQLITVNAAEDLDPEGTLEARIAHTVASTDANYSDVKTPVRAVTVLVVDNDSPGVIVGESGGETFLIEGDGDGDTYTLVLTQRPTAPVTVAIGTEDQLTAVPASVTFQSTDYAVAKTIRLVANNNGQFEDLHYQTVTHAVTSDDSAYEGLAASDLTAWIEDGEIAQSQGGGGGSGSVPLATLLLLFSLGALRARIRNR